MKLSIIGASGHGKVVADIAVQNGYDEIEFYDDNAALSFCGKWPVVGAIDDALTQDNDVFVAIGNAAVRERLIERFNKSHIPTLVHPSAVIADDVVIGIGSVVMAGVVINPGTAIGKGVIVNTCSSIDHDCVIGDYVHISVGAHLSGTVKVGKGTWISAGVTVANNIDVCRGCTIGAGTVVIRDIDESGTYVGIPARRLR